MATVWDPTLGIRSGRATQLLTETAPTTGNVGVSMEGVGCISIVLQAPAGQTFDGVGTMLGYRFLSGQWMRAPRSDYDMADFAGLNVAAPPALIVDGPVGRFIYIPDSVGLSGAGTTIVTDYLCTTRHGQQGIG